MSKFPLDQLRYLESSVVITAQTFLCHHHKKWTSGSWAHKSEVRFWRLFIVCLSQITSTTVRAFLNRPEQGAVRSWSQWLEGFFNISSSSGTTWYNCIPEGVEAAVFLLSIRTRKRYVRNYKWWYIRLTRIWRKILNPLSKSFRFKVGSKVSLALAKVAVLTMMPSKTFD